MNKEIKKEVLKFYKKKDFKGLETYLKNNNLLNKEDVLSDWINRIYANLLNTPYLNGDDKLIKRHFMGYLENLK